MADCKYGDPTCPCQDGDMCHYKAGWTTKAWPVPPEFVDAALAKKDAEIERLQAEKIEMLALVQSIKHVAFKQSLADGERVMDICHFIADSDTGSQFGPFELRAIAPPPNTGGE